MAMAAEDFMGESGGLLTVDVKTATRSRVAEAESA
jgi:hypothetical protein